MVFQRWNWIRGLDRMRRPRYHWSRVVGPVISWTFPGGHFTQEEFKVPGLFALILWSGDKVAKISGFGCIRWKPVVLTEKNHEKWKVPWPLTHDHETGAMHVIQRFLGEWIVRVKSRRNGYSKQTCGYPLQCWASIREMLLWGLRLFFNPCQFNRSWLQAVLKEGEQFRFSFHRIFDVIDKVVESTEQ